MSIEANTQGGVNRRDFLRLGIGFAAVFAAAYSPVGREILKASLDVLGNATDPDKYLGDQDKLGVVGTGPVENVDANILQEKGTVGIIQQESVPEENPRSEMIVLREGEQIQVDATGAYNQPLECSLQEKDHQIVVKCLDGDGTLTDPVDIDTQGCTALIPSQK